MPGPPMEPQAPSEPGAPTGEPDSQPADPVPEQEPTHQQGEGEQDSPFAPHVGDVPAAETDQPAAEPEVLASASNEEDDPFEYAAPEGSEVAE